VKKIVQVLVMSLMLTAIFTSINTPAIAGVNGPIAMSPAPMPLCAPGDPNCKPGPWWPPQVKANMSPAPMPLCAPGDKTCKPGPWWPPQVTLTF
jgi:hypothetical protein